MTTIYPRCQTTDVTDYISAEGYVMPCCWMGNQPFINDYFALFADCLAEMTVETRPLKDILNDPRYQRISQTWVENPPLVCQKMCSKPKAVNSQGQDRYRDVFKRSNTIPKKEAGC